jgi:hypothetical protein
MGRMGRMGRLGALPADARGDSRSTEADISSPADNFLRLPFGLFMIVGSWRRYGRVVI